MKKDESEISNRSIDSEEAVVADPARKITKAKTPFVWLRRLVLFLGIIALGSVVLIFIAYNFGKESLDPSAPGDQAPPTSTDTVTSGRNVDYVQTSGGRQVFRVRAAKSLQDKADTSFLEDAIFDFYREGATSYTIQCQKARLNQRTGEAHLEGDVIVTGFGDLVLKARSLDLLQNGQILESLGVVEFTNKNPDLIGRASNMKIDRIHERVEMGGGVHVRSSGTTNMELRLDCLQLTYSKAEKLIRASEKVFLRYEDQELRANFLSFFLDEEQGTLRSLRARYDVEGRIDGFDSQGGSLKAVFTSDFLEIEPDEKNPSSRILRLDGVDNKAVSLKQVLDDGLVRAVQGMHLEARIEESKVAEIHGTGLPVRVDEYLDFSERVYLRRACATNFRAFAGPDGSFSHLLLDGQVDLQEVGIQLSGGNEAKVNGVEGTIEMTGAPVEVNAQQGELAAPLIRYSRKTGILRALSGVRAAFKNNDGALGDALGSSAEGTIRVDAEEASLSGSPRSFTFKGQVRAWQGDNFLFADQMRGDGAKQELSAAGKVKTIWMPPKKGEETPLPIVVTADTLSYRRSESKLSYQGNSRLDQQGRFLHCNDLTLELTSKAPTEVERLVCRDKVLIDDTIGGQRVTGDFATYDPRSAAVEVTGEEVHLIDGQKNEFVGRFLTYDFKSGKASLRSQAPSANSAQ